MKRFLCIKGIFWPGVLLALVLDFQISSGQTNKDLTTPIPDNINKIFQTSCYQCHGVNGKIMPRTKLDFSKWTEYDSVEGAEKASGICSEITEGLMPPKSVRKSNPELIPTKEQIGLICKWAESLKSKELGK